MYLFSIGDTTQFLGIALPVAVLLLCILFLRHVYLMQRAPQFTAKMLESEAERYSFPNYLKLQMVAYQDEYLNGQNLAPFVRHLPIRSNLVFEAFMHKLHGVFDSVDDHGAHMIRNSDGKSGFTTIKCRLDKKTVWVVVHTGPENLKEFKKESVDKNYLFMLGNRPSFLTINSAVLLYARNHELKLEAVVNGINTTQQAQRKTRDLKNISRKIPLYTLTKVKDTYKPIPRTSDMSDIMNTPEILKSAYNDIEFSFGGKSVEVPMDLAIEYVTTCLKRGINVGSFGNPNTCKSTFLALVGEKLAKDDIRVCHIQLLDKYNAEDIAHAVVEATQDGVFTVFIVDDCGNAIHNTPDKQEHSYHTAIKNMLDSVNKTLGKYSFLISANYSEHGFLPAIVRNGRLGVTLKFTELSAERAHNTALAITNYLKNNPEDTRFFDWKAWESKKFQLEATNGTIAGGEIFAMLRDPVVLSTLDHLDIIGDYIIDVAARGNQNTRIQEGLKAAVQDKIAEKTLGSSPADVSSNDSGESSSNEVDDDEDISMKNIRESGEFDTNAPETSSENPPTKEPKIPALGKINLS